MTDEPQRHLILNWTLDAPRADVFRAWTDPDHLQWFYNPAQPIPDEPIELDLRVGGVWRQRMVISEQMNYVTGGVYREIVRDEKLVFNWGAAGGWPELDPRTARGEPARHRHAHRGPRADGDEPPRRPASEPRAGPGAGVVVDRFP
jgi:uncharacterized protein YndB with AHSA1/START domain